MMFYKAPLPWDEADSPAQLLPGLAELATEPQEFVATPEHPAPEQEA